jgi:nicotinamide-nucleotide amidase
MESLAAQVLAALGRRDATIACAESLTGGGLAAALTAVPGASVSMRGGVVSYATEVKRELLGVTAELVVSAECAEQMARGVRSLLSATWGLSTTGVAGPDTQDGQPVGTVFVGIAGPDGVHARRLALVGDRDAIRSATVAAALESLADALD